MHTLHVMGSMLVVLLLTVPNVAHASSAESFCEELAGATSVEGASSLEALLLEFSFGPQLVQGPCTQALQEVFDPSHTTFVTEEADTCASSFKEPSPSAYKIAEHSAMWRVHELPEFPKPPAGFSCDITDQLDTCGSLPPTPIEVSLASAVSSGHTQTHLLVPAKRRRTWVRPLRAIAGSDLLGPACGYDSIPEQPPRG